MTSDAKVGVLLGLVFIFIVAFLINGLGDLKSDKDNNELTEKMVQSYIRSPGLGGSERKVSQELIEQIEPVQPDLVDIWEQSRAESEAERFRMQLPVIVNKEIQENKADVLMQEEAVKMEVKKAEVPVTVAKIEPARKEIKLTLIKPPSQRIYVVKAGDSLASIAKEVYGEEHGNRMDNVQGIFEANRERLKSADEVYEGQKLLIPPLADVLVEKEKPSSVLPETILEAVKSIGRRHQDSEEVKEVKEVKKPEIKGRWYKVKEDDSLWKIATQELGDGNRYPEITKLNAALLSDEDSLDIGMRLKLPVN
ncbi:MAG: LysM peptidoglycan-binding domain-containing protein [Planctomycetota bacterium]|jgi:nucleoid-associated protein YgaU